jgi:hypothetical protein
MNLVGAVCRPMGHNFLYLQHIVIAVGRSLPGAVGRGTRRPSVWE